MQFKKEAERLHSKLIREEIDGEVRYFRKRRVYPNLDEEGKVLWFNTLTGGSWWKVLGVILFVIIALGFAFEYKHNFEQCTQVMNDVNAYKVNHTKIIGADGQALGYVPYINFSGVNIKN